MGAAPRPDGAADGRGAPLRRLVVTVAGTACLAVGVVLWALPLLPGTPLVLAGIGLLGSEYPWVRRRAIDVARRLTALARSWKASDRKEGSW